MEEDSGYKITWTRSDAFYDPENPEPAKPNFSNKLFYKLSDNYRILYYTVIDASRHSGNITIPFNSTAGATKIDASLNGKFTSYEIQ